MLDGQLIAAAIQSRSAWERIAAHFEIEEFSTLPKFWIPLIAQWYARDSLAKSIDKAALATAGKLRISNPKNEEALLGFLSDLPEAPSPENLVQVALEFKRYNVGMELGAAIGARDHARVSALLPRFTELQAATSLSQKKRAEWRDAVVIETLFDKVGKENRIAIAPQKLNDKVNGGALPGHHIVIFARPEEGKSTFAINMAGSFVRRSIRTMYVGNEDQIDLLKVRAAARLTGMTAEQMEQNKAEAFKRFREAGGEDHLLMTQLAHGTVEAIARRVEEWEPQVLIIDQIRNLSVGKTDGMTQKLEELGIEVRALLIDYGLIGVTVTQANPSDRLYLGMEDIDSSKTGLPAQADLLVGLNSNDEMKANNTRAVSIAKNKLSSASNAHAGFIVQINKALSKVT